MAMPTTPMLQSVVLWQNHQTTTPHLPFTSAGTAATAAARIDIAKPATQKEDPVDNPPFDTVEEDDGEEEKENGEENEESDEEQNG